MKRIFVSLVTISLVLLTAAFVLGLSISDPASRDPAVGAIVNWHFLTALFALIFAALVHAIVLTYFMGTGRWMEETTQAYRLSGAELSEARTIKYRTIPLMVVCLLLLVATGSLGAVADPASPVKFDRFAMLGPATLHLVVAIATVAINLAVNGLEYAAIARNHELIGQVLAEVRRIRAERGLPVE